MTHTLAQADPAAYMSFINPIAFLAVMVGWGWLASRIDKDADYFHLPRRWINVVVIAVGIIAATLMLTVPLFIIGLVSGAAVVIAGFFAYVLYRNPRVSPDSRWTWSVQSVLNVAREYEQARAQRKSSVHLIDAKTENVMPVPKGDGPEAQAHQTLEDVMSFALQRGAERIDISAEKDRTQIVVYVDGLKYPQPELDATSGVRLIDYLKMKVGLDLGDRRKRQSASLYVRAGDMGRFELELSTAGTTRGQSLAFKIDPRKQVQFKLKDLGLLESQRQRLEQTINEPGRVILVTAPAHQGVSTTLYTFVQQHDPYTSGVTCFEESKGYEIEGVNQHPLGENVAPAQFREQLGQVLRADPDVLMLPRIPDSAIAKQMARAAEQVRIYAGLPDEDTFSALRRWVKLVGDKSDAVDALAGIVAQRLVRRLCRTCRTPYKPDPAALKKLNLAPDRVGQLYMASGQVMVKDEPKTCPDCFGMGYRGRIGVFELMILDDPARALISGGQLEQARSHLRKQKMFMLQEAALTKVVEGVTDIKEINRGLGGASPGETAPKRPSPMPAPAAAPPAKD
ncbi:MAG: ATPase, T2SS/T4P/T4SS family [Phycisphaeraceae bacterium]